MTPFMKHLRDNSIRVKVEKYKFLEKEFKIYKIDQWILVGIEDGEQIWMNPTLNKTMKVTVN